MINNKTSFLTNNIPFSSLFISYISFFIVELEMFLQQKLLCMMLPVIFYFFLGN
ncbi:hypothetical protein RV15_GL000114 [Enterococcus silesiacus]|uniref:Uncharacterized protein n=1 Tax=Enterococcus silesiacus TaxID=332949 RepID=A0AA91GKJ0_9ENTE|nr:hypothetical protein RV15_GL000114 [Enterococcus silesiacus]